MEENKQVSEPGGSELEKELAECKVKRDEYLARWQRAKADFLNYKKEEMLRIGEIARYGTEELLLDLIGALDSFDLGIAALEKAGPVEKGIYMIRTQIEDVMKRRGLERIKVIAGTMFDPAVHEAVSDVESDKSPGTILEEIEAGYRLYEKVLRPARVKVAKEKR